MVKNMLPKRHASRLAALLLSVAWIAVASTAARAEPPVPQGPVVTDWRTGLALYGVDPVAYFTDSQPLPGVAGVELDWSGTTWRFRNEGNRAAFAANPDVYMPAFGGHDPIAAARGVAVPGNPLIWLMSGTRIFLFHTAKARDAFSANAEPAIAAAEARWPGIAQAHGATGSITPLDVTDTAADAAPPPDHRTQ
jgi:hypothetical protein